MKATPSLCQREGMPVHRPSAAAVLRDAALGTTFDQRVFDPALFPPVFVHHSVRTCKVSMEKALRLGGKMNELMQEVAFIDFFKAHYPLISNNEDSYCAQQHTRRRILIFLPICIYAEHAGTSTDGSDNISYSEAGAAVSQPDLQRVVAKLHLHGVDSSRCFFAMPSMLLHPTWKYPLKLCRGLILDRDMSGSSHDVIVPYSATRQDQVNGSARARRELLVFGAGGAKFFGMYGGIRSEVSSRTLATRMCIDVHATLIKQLSMRACHCRRRLYFGRYLRLPHRHMTVTRPLHDAGISAARGAESFRH